MMKEFSCKSYGEEFTANIYEIVLKQSIGQHILVYQEDKWVSSEQVQDVQDLIEWGTKSELREKDGVAYANDEMIGFLDAFLLICAIGSNPQGHHMIQSKHANVWVDWKQHKKVYELVCTHATLQKDFPEYDASNPVANSFSPNHWIPNDGGYQENHDGLSVASSLDMNLKNSFPAQIRAQINFPWPLRGVLRSTWSLSKGSFDRESRKIVAHIQQQIIENGTCYVPYIGSFRVLSGRVCFSSSRILKDRIKGKQAATHRVDAGRIYGGEKHPGQSILFWGHQDQENISRRRQFVKGFSGSRGNLAISNIAYQAFVDSFFYRLHHGIKIVLQGVGTVRVNDNHKISFRTSKTLRQKLQNPSTEDNTTN